MSMILRFLLIAVLCGGCGQSEPVVVESEPQGDPARGRLLIEQLSCTACHIIPGIEGPRGMIGPSLEHMATRSVVAQKVENTPTNVAKWIQNPQGFDPANTMPALGINDADARDITAYLFTLK